MHKMGTSAEVLVATGTFQPSRNERQERLNDFSKDTWREAVPEITSPLRPWLMFCSLICCPLVTNAAWGCRRMDVLHGVGLHMYSCNENALNLIQNKLHFSTCLQRYRVLLVKITLVSMGDCEHALSLTSSSLLPAPSGIFFWGAVFFQGLVGVLLTFACYQVHERRSAPDTWLFLIRDGNLLCSFCWLRCPTLHLACLVLTVAHTYRVTPLNNIVWDTCVGTACTK